MFEAQSKSIAAVITAQVVVTARVTAGVRIWLGENLIKRSMTRTSVWVRARM